MVVYYYDHTGKYKPYLVNINCPMFHFADLIGVISGDLLLNNREAKRIDILQPGDCISRK